MRARCAASSAAVLFFSFILCACAVRPDEPAVRAAPRVFLRFAEERAADHPSAQACREIVRLAAADSDGALQLRVYDEGKLGDEGAVIEQLRFGGIDLARVQVRSLEDFSAAAGSLGVSGRFPTGESMRAAMEGAEGAALAEELMAEKLVLLAWYDGGPEARLLPFDRPDFAGLKVGIESSRSAIALVIAEGGTPVPLSLGDFRSAQESGLAEGFLSTLVTAQSERLLGLLRAESIPDSRILELVVASRVTFMKLLPADRTIIARAAADSALLHSGFRSSAEERSLAEIAARKLP